jgi:integrase
MKNRFLHEEDYARLLTHINERLVANPTAFELIVAVLMATGCRSDEALKLKRSDINFKSGEIEIHSSKGSNANTPKLPNIITKHLNTMLVGDKTLGEVFAPDCTAASQKRVLRRYWKRLCYSLEFISDLGLHSIRHSVATRYLDLKTGDIRGLQLLLGHKNISSTTHYMTNYDYARVAETLKKISGIIS